MLRTTMWRQDSSAGPLPMACDDGHGASSPSPPSPPSPPAANLRGPDHALVCIAQRGDRDAFGALVRKYRQRVLNLATRYLRNHEDAEDAVQEIFLKAYCGLPMFRGESAFYSWLHRIAINSTRTAITQRTRLASIVSSDGVGAGTAAESAAPQGMDIDSPEALALTAEICAAVDTALDDLCEELRTAIVMREIEGLTYKEIAKSMSCPIGTVRSRVFRAREAIDQQLRNLSDQGLGRVHRRR